MDIRVKKKYTMIPKLPHPFLYRAGLQEEFGEYMGTLFVLGKPGSGKRSAAIQLCGDCSSVIWFRFEPEDNLESRFVRRLADVFSPDSGSYDTGIILDGLEDLFGSSGLTLVLEDLHLIKNPKVEKIINKILFMGEDRVRFIVTSERELSPVFAEFLMHGNYRELREDKLWFSFAEWQELAELFEQAMGELYACDLKAEYEKNMGWPVICHGDLMGRNLVTYSYMEHNLWQGLRLSEQQAVASVSALPELSEELFKTCFDGVFPAKLFSALVTKFVINGREGSDEEYFLHPAIARLGALHAGNIPREKVLTGALDHYWNKADYEAAFNCIKLLEREEHDWSIPELERGAILYYRRDDRKNQEAYLNIADSMFGRENRFGAYRSLYRGLSHWEEDREKYEKQINNALFFLEENHIPLPFLMPQDEEILRKIKEERQKEQVGLSEEKQPVCRIRVNAFGTFKVVMTEDGKELSWRTRKGCELFAYLLEMDGKPVERKTLMLKLWEDDMPNNAVAMLHNMIYNIRKELSYYNLDQVVCYKQKAYSLDMTAIKSDLERISEAAALVEKRDPEKLAEKKSIFEEYWGRYLEDMDSNWVRDRQEYFEKIYEEGCSLLAGYFYEQKNLKDALAMYKKAISRNPYSEELMAGIIKCCRELRNPKDGKKYYSQFCDKLMEELGIRPGKELQRLYKEAFAG